MPRTRTETLPFRTGPSLARRLASALDKAMQRRRNRMLLSRLDDHLLRDIGLSADTARTECAKPFWQP